MKKKIESTMRFGLPKNLEDIISFMNYRINEESQSCEIRNLMNLHHLNIPVNIKVEKSSYYKSKDNLHFIKIEGKLEIPSYPNPSNFVSTYFLEKNY